MFKFALIGLILFSNFLHATIIKTNEIAEVKNEATANTLVLFNLNEVLIDTQTELGTQAWRKYIKSRVDSKIHDQLAYYTFIRMPIKTPEVGTAQLIQELQQEGVATFGFT